MNMHSIEARGDVAEGEDLVLPPQDRVDHDGCPDVRDDQQELEEHSEIDLAVLAATGNIGGRVVENGLEESERRYRGDERDDEQHSEDPSISLVGFHR